MYPETLTFTPSAPLATRHAQFTAILKSLHLGSKRFEIHPNGRISIYHCYTEIKLLETLADLGLRVSYWQCGNVFILEITEV